MNRGRMNELSSLFDDVYDEIDTEGWAKGQESQPWEGPCCLYHALIRVATRGNRQHLVAPAARIMQEHIGGSIVMWNDRKKTSYAVLVLLETLADRYRLPGESNLGGW